MGTEKLKMVAVTILAFFLLACAWIVLTPCPTGPPLRAPSYVESVWPPAESETPLGCYIRRYLFVRPVAGGVGVKIDTRSLWELEVTPAYTKKFTPLANRISLYVDGAPAPITGWEAGGGSTYIEVNGKTMELDVGGWRYVTSDHFMRPGDHRAKVVIVTTAGKTLEYEWYFRIK